MIRYTSRRSAIVLALAVLSVSLACSTSKQPSNGNVARNHNDATSGSPASSGPSVLEGYHDIAGCDGIVGWGWDQNRPDEPIKVEIYEGNNLVASVTADTFRKDLLDAHKGNGKHGFTYPLPPQLKDGKPHSIRVKYAGTDIDLANTPKQINCKLEGS